MKVKPRTKEEILVKTAELIRELKLFEMELLYEEAESKFGMTYEGWYDERVTLDVALEEMMATMTLCTRISVLGAGNGKNNVG